MPLTLIPEWRWRGQKQKVIDIPGRIFLPEVGDVDNATAKKLWSVEGKVEVMAIENVLFQFPDRRKVDQKNIQPKLDRRKRSQKVIAK